MTEEYATGFSFITTTDGRVFCGHVVSAIKGEGIKVWGPINIKNDEHFNEDNIEMTKLTYKLLESTYPGYNSQSCILSIPNPKMGFQLSIDDQNRAKTFLLISLIKNNFKYTDEDDEKMVDVNIYKRTFNLHLLSRVDDLPFSNRSKNWMKKNNIYLLHDLVQLTEEEICPSLGPQSFKEIKGILEKLNLKLGMKMKEAPND